MEEIAGLGFGEDVDAEADVVSPVFVEDLAMLLRESEASRGAAPGPSLRRLALNVVAKTTAPPHVQALRSVAARGALRLLCASDHDAGSRGARQPLPRAKWHDGGDEGPHGARRRRVFASRPHVTFSTGQRRRRRCKQSLGVGDVGSRGRLWDHPRRGPALVGHTRGWRARDRPPREGSFGSTAGDRHAWDRTGLARRCRCRR